MNKVQAQFAVVLAIKTSVSTLVAQEQTSAAQLLLPQMGQEIDTLGVLIEEDIMSRQPRMPEEVVTTPPVTDKPADKPADVTPSAPATEPKV